MLKVWELFGGIGAPRKALENIGIDFKTIEYIEIDKTATLAYNKLYNENFEPQDITTWDYMSKENPDLIIHGSPCQDFSVAGKNDLTKGRSILYLKSIEIIKNKKPKYVVWENVKGLITNKNKSHFDYYLDCLKDDYNHYYKVLIATDFGIPQKRERIFTISIRKDIDTNTFNLDNLEKKPMRALKQFLENNVNIKYYIKQQSMVKAIEQGKIKVINNEIDTNTNDIANTITTKQFRWNNGGVIKIPFSTFNQENYVHIATNDNVQVPTITATGANSRIKIALPIVKHFFQDIPIFIINDKQYVIRVLTPRECWRLMGFTDNDYNKVEPLLKDAQLYKLAGNSIVVQVLEAIFKSLLNQIGEK